MNSIAIPTRESKAVLRGVLAASVVAAIHLLGALWMPVPYLLLALLFLGVAIGLRKGRPWSGYGGALLLIALVSGAVVSLMSLPGREIPTGAIAGAILLYALPVLLLYRAARSLGPIASQVSFAWIFLALIAFVFPVVFHPFVIPTGAMENTLLIGDRILVRTIGLPTPRRGQIIAFRNPVDRTAILIKRIVAAGGDQVQLRDKKLFVNEVEQEESFAHHSTTYIDAFRDNFPQEAAMPPSSREWADVLRRNTVSGKVVIPPGKLFVMGDNRDVSLDSRYFGFVSPDDIIGKPTLIYFSYDAPSDSLLNQNSVPSPPLLHPGRLRWTRMFTLLP